MKKRKTSEINWEKSWDKVLLSLLVFVAITFVSWLGENPTREGKMVIFMATAALAGSSYIGRKYHPLIGLLSAYWCALWYFNGMYAFGTLMSVGSMGMLFLANYLLAEEWFLLHCLRASLYAQLAVVLLQYNGYNFMGLIQPELWHEPYPLTGTMGHQLDLAIYFAALTPLALKYWSRIEALAMVAFVFYMGSTMGILGLLAAGLFYCWRKKPKTTLAAGSFVALICVAGVFLFPQIEFFSLSGRMLPWSASWHFINADWQHYLFGYGPGSWFGKNDDWGVKYFQRWDMLHSDWLGLWHETGLVGLVLGFAAACAAIYGASTYIGCAMAALFVSAIGGFNFHLPAHAFIFCYLLAKKFDRSKFV